MVRKPTRYKDWIRYGKKEVSMEAGLWKACNDLRGNVSATDYVNVVLGLLFFRFAFDNKKGVHLVRRTPLYC